ncbi:TPA: DNA-directed RNA polymerase subunit alpha [Candidatus Gastranaerophilales bacterium HUM_9]|nr:MAG TPA: DNA-directed RNA polymerase subunit alpha [Candidatus Gastranaerophilales bacterium HUM_9]HBX34449.1 DNA-directed RNA polymerase subunit alpha [Cyanobacteria bacterium UBA11440]
MDLEIKTVNTATSSDGSQYGKFVISPLERGFGITIGNSLRRVLLSSLEGTAVTSARIEGITHEYTAIPGVLEDVVDVLLNFKGLSIKTESAEPQVLRIDIDKPGPVLASDIELPAGVKIVNPDWLICTIAEGGSFHAEITVETGKGYVPNDVPRNREGVAIDMLPIDATFMPIKRVKYDVENTRVGDSIDFDKLTLEVWSNGTIDVTTAVSQAANLLIEHFVQIASISGQSSVLPSFEKAMSSSVIEDEAVEPSEEEPSISIEELELSVRAYNCLKRASINSMSELLKKSEHDLLIIKNFGKKSADEVIEKLHEHGLDLAPNPEMDEDGVLIGE